MKHLILGALFSLTNFTFCQENENLFDSKFGLELNTSATFTSGNFTPTLSYSFGKKSKLCAGIGFNFYNEWSFPIVPFSAIELTAGYKFFPNGTDNKVNFYFHFLTKHFIFNMKSQFSGEPKLEYYNENFLGYGFEVPIGKRCYFLHDIGVGSLISWRTFETQPTELNYLSISGYFRVGFGIKFNK